MILRLIRPSRELAPFIRTYWYLKTDTSKDVLQTIVPNGLMGFFFFRSDAPNYCGFGKYQSGLGGQRMKTLMIQSYNVESVGVEFEPYGLRRFFPMSSMDFYGLVCSPQDISDKELMTLEEQIITVQDINQCWNMLNNFFLSRLAKVKSDDINFKRINSAVVAANGSIDTSVEAMADKANLSPKQFRRVFSEYVGIMPKGYLRLVRHQRIMEYLLKASRQTIDLPSLDELSWSFGYYSASHLNTDFKDIMGYNPSELLKRHAPESYSWVDIEKTSKMIG